MEPYVVLLTVGVLLLMVVGVAGLFESRRRTLTQRVGSFSCGWRPADEPDGAEVAATSPVGGTAQYAVGRLDWWRTRSLSPRPVHTWRRDELTVLDRRPLNDQEGPNRMLVVRCRHGRVEFDLTMSAEACAGLVSWLESGPRRTGPVV
ncbi:DUF2550 domain-containing protein [Actinotalea sp. K2]|uniref:DUF2550 domain-containing protein n=1 Tax=Actinotalea sp. K2 TaxID=2939438 RepID=UPI0020179129|nr:DUF2550 domain-containing protein [Actinotalea sp. K2]MCL3860456.1 DUF2550 domain-containing protein [Actinotalea sp. K2]